MPPNFRDAVKVTRALGLRYIWIDSLCIIQDSFADWQYESQRMAQVYANAYITIVATCAASAHEGFLTRPRTSFPPTKIPYSTTEHGPGFFYLCPRYTHWLANDHDEFVEGSNWNSRGWTFQERLLSTRLL